MKTDALEPGHKVSRYAFLAVMLGISTAVFDGIGITVALPTIGREFALSDAATTWVVNAYQLTVIAAMLPLAALGDVVGQKRLYLTGLALLASMALLSALAPSFGWVIAARAVQGLGAACVTCVNLSLIRHIVPPDRLGRAFGFNATVVALAATLGPSLAGAIISIASWQAVFGLTVIVGLCAFLVGLFALPNIERGADRFDSISAVFSAAAFGGVLLGLRRAGPFVAVYLGTGLAGGRGSPRAFCWSSGSAGGPRPCCRSTCWAIPFSHFRWGPGSASSVPRC